MAWETGTAANNFDLYERIGRFVTGCGVMGAVGYTGTGNGTFTRLGTFSSGTKPAAVTETWTLTCTSEAANAGTFSVVGSVSGAQSNATVGVDYSNTFLDFRINDGTIDFEVGDAFTFTVTQGALKTEGQEWIALGRASDQTGGQWLRGRGLAGTDNIYCDIAAFNQQAGIDVYQFGIAAALDFNPAFTRNGQVGFIGNAYMGTWNTSMPYWIVANGQRFIVVAKVSTTYHSIYFGKILPYYTPSEYAYPVYLGGETTTITERWSSTSQNYRSFTQPGLNGAWFYKPEGVWQTLVNGENSSGNLIYRSANSVWPHHESTDRSNYIAKMQANIDGSYSLLPCVIMATSPTNLVAGELDGAFIVSGFNNAAENIITIDGVQYLVVQNIFRTAIDNYWALRLQ
jgi:hypothetical protein